MRKGNVGLRVLVLISESSSRISGRVCRAPCDARAVELSLKIPGAEVILVYAGPENAELESLYLGMGAPILHHLNIKEDSDPTPSIINHLKQMTFDLVLTGISAGSGLGSGILPYALAYELGFPLLPAISNLRVSGNYALVNQNLSGGLQRLLRAPLPSICTVTEHASYPRLTSRLRARRGIVVRTQGIEVQDKGKLSLVSLPARLRPKRIHAKNITGSALERIDMLTSTANNTREILMASGPEEAANAILEFLRTEQIIAL